MILTKGNINSDYITIAKILSEHDLFSNLSEISKEYRSESKPSRYCTLTIYYPFELRYQTVNILNERHVFNVIAEYRKLYYEIYFNYDKNKALISKYYIYAYNNAVYLSKLNENYNNIISNPHEDYYEFTPFKEKMLG